MHKLRSQQTPLVRAEKQSALICVSPASSESTRATTGSVSKLHNCADGMHVRVQLLLSIGMLVAGRRNLIAAFQLKNRISGLSQASRLFTTKMSHTDEGTAAGLLVKR